MGHNKQNNLFIMSDHDDMMNDYDWHQNTGELPEYFGDDESEYIGKHPNYSQSDGGSFTGCILVIAIIIIVGIIIWLI